MTGKEELRYLIGLVAEASKFDGESEQDNVRLEVEMRIASLIEGMPEEAPDAQKPKTSSHAGHVSVRRPDGTRKWVPREACVQVPNQFSRTGFSWKLKEEVDDAK